MKYFKEGMQNQIMWIANIKTFEILECTRGLKEEFRVGIDADWTGAKLHYKVDRMWFSESVAESIETNKEVSATGTTHVTGMWSIFEDTGQIRKYIITRSKWDDDCNLSVAQNITASDTRIQYYEQLDFTKRVVNLDNGNELTFKAMEALALMARGYTNKASATKLSITEAAVKARLVQCVKAMKCKTLNEVRVLIASNGMHHTLLTAILPPYPYGDEIDLKWMLKTISPSEA